jgi:hypothetical protein
MSRFRIRRPSPALVVASLALLLSLGGSAYAAGALAPGSVGTHQLRNGAVTSDKLANGAVTANKVRPYSLLSQDFAPGQLAAGPQGPAGAAGPQGPAGRQGPAGISGYQVITSTSTMTATFEKAVAANCPVGESVLGGGVSGETSSLDTLVTQQSYPNNDNAQWFGAAYDLTANPSPWTLVVYAICGSVS